MRIEVTALGERVFSRDLLRFGENVGDLTDAMREVAVILRQASERQFQTEGAYTGERWPELAASTQLDRIRHGFPPRHPILQRTHRLMDSLTRAVDPDHIEEPSADSLRFGTRVRHAVYHQSSRPRHKIPYRPPVGLTEADKRLIVRAIQREVMEGVRGGGTGLRSRAPSMRDVGRAQSGFANLFQQGGGIQRASFGEGGFE